jgi:hypothetical protein
MTPMFLLGTRSSLPGPGDVASGPVGRADSDSPPADAETRLFSQAATLGRVGRVGVGKAPQMRPEVSEKRRGMSLLVLLVGNF